MHLKINLASREDIAAAVPLLQMILAGTVAGGSAGVVLTEADAAADLAGTPRPNNPTVVINPPFPVLTETVQDAAAVFGGTPASAPPFVPPIVAPSTVGAPASPNAPEAPQAGAAMPTPGAFPSVPPTGLVVPVPTAGATGANPANGVDLDSTGLPWDARIHAGSKSKNKDGSWTAKRGLNDEAAVNAIKAELRASLASGAQAGAAFPPPLTPSAPSLPPMPGAAPFVPPVVSSPPAPPVAPSAPVAPPETFDQLMLRVVPFLQSGYVPPDAVEKAAQAYRLPNLTSLQQNPAYVPHVWGYLQQQYPDMK